MKILLAVEASPASEVAVEEVTGLSWPEGTQVEVLTVADTVDSEYAAGKELVDDLAMVIRDTGLSAHASVAGGDPKQVILERAEAYQPDLIVLGFHRATPVADLFLSNVASHTLRNANCSVAIVRPRADGDLVPRRVLLATDGSPSAELAAREIAGRPWPVRTEIRVLSVMDAVLPSVHALFEPPFIHSEEVQRIREEGLLHAQKAVADAVAILKPSGLPISESVSILLDGTKNVILNEARDWGADWIFLGSHGHQSTAERILMGSVSESVANDAPCSVQVVRQPKSA